MFYESLIIRLVMLYLIMNLGSNRHPRLYFTWMDEIVPPTFECLDFPKPVILIFHNQILNAIKSLVELLPTERWEIK